jgi:hypothetical protein
MEKYQAALRRRAAKAGHGLFARKPHTFAQSVRKMRIR